MFFMTDRMQLLNKTPVSDIGGSMYPNSRRMLPPTPVFITSSVDMTEYGDIDDLQDYSSKVGYFVLLYFYIFKYLDHKLVKSGII